MGNTRQVSGLLVLSVALLGAVLSVNAHAAENLPVQDAWLRDYLPDDTLLYARIPHPFGMLAAPKGNAFDAALRNDANMTTVARIREGISDNVLPRIPTFQDVRLRLLEKHLRSPVEMAILPLPAPSLLVSANLDIETAADFEAVFEEIAEQEPGMFLVGPLDDRGAGQIEGLGVPAFLQFDATTSQLLLNVGPSVSAEAFGSLIDSVTRNDDHEMRTLESRVDESGQGLFVWVNAERALPMAMMMMQPEQYEQVTNVGLDKASSAAFGWGVANGKGRIAIVANMRPEYDRGFVPLVSNDVTAKSVGEPDGLFLMSIPTAEEFQRIEARILDAVEADSFEEWDDAKAEMLERVGFSFEDLLNAVGPEAFLVFDEAGDYGALRLRDRKLWDRILKGAEKVAESKPEKRKIDGRTYYHWSMKGDLMDLDASPETSTHWFAELFGRQNDHTYWTYDDDYVYFASIPQILIDRDSMGANTSIGEWLVKRQRIDTSAAVLSISGTSDKLPERIYAVYLEVLQLLADVGQVDIDLWTMPSARQLGLPREGTLGFTISLGEPMLGMEFTFENNPAEFLGGVGGIATVGVLAAIAIPAYQDYTVRAKVAEGLMLSAPAKASVTDHYFSTGGFPGPMEAAQMSNPDAAGQHVRSVIVEPGSGRVLVDFKTESIPDGAQLYLRPVPMDDGGLEWKCGSTLPDKQLPADCRGGAESGYSGA